MALLALVGAPRGGIKYWTCSAACRHKIAIPDSGIAEVTMTRVNKFQPEREIRNEAELVAFVSDSTGYLIIQIQNLKIEFSNIL